MAGVYAGIAGVLLSVLALTLLRDAAPHGWFTVLFVLLVGGTLELMMNGPTGYLYHHVGLFGYVFAWLAALVLAYNPTFRAATSRASAPRLPVEPHASSTRFPAPLQSDGGS